MISPHIVLWVRSLTESAIKTASAASQHSKGKFYKSYFFTTHFWGPFVNWGLPLAAIADMYRSPAIISPRMTAVLMCYSALFMRFSLAVKPRNLMLFAVHATNEIAQTIQMYRWASWDRGEGGNDGDMTMTTETG